MDPPLRCSYPSGVQPGRFLLRIVATIVQQLRRALWRAGWPRRKGVLTVPLTPEGRLILVRLTYAPGWHLPGGGIARGEDAKSAALRELAEEIGMTSHGEVILLEVPESRLYLVRDVHYAPRRSIEVEDVAEFALDALPATATPVTRSRVGLARNLIAAA